jgi:hypothetical protein
MSSNQNKKINFYGNDPSAVEVPLKETKYTVNNIPQKWNIDNNSNNINLFNPGTLDFQCCQINLTLSRCVGLWNESFNGGFTSWSSTQALNVFPQVDYRTDPEAEDGFNAYYDRQNLVFFFDKDRLKNETVYTSESLEIVSHEAGHAILDAVQPDFWSTLLPEIRAFHEAFGDCSAILTTLGDENVRTAFLKVSDPLTESNCVSKLAEELGHGLFSIYGRDASPEECLRNGINDFKYKNPNTLPSGGPDTILTRGGHSFSRVFTGAFYGSLVRMFKLVSQEISNKDQALIQATNHMKQILSGAVASTFVTSTLYRDIAVSMLKIDDQIFHNKYRQAIIDAFVEKNILSSISGHSLANNIKLQSATGSAKSLDEIKVPANVKDIKNRKFAEEVSEFLGMSNNDNLNLTVQDGIKDDFIMVKGTKQEWVNLKTDSQDLPENVKVFLPSGFNMIVDTKNKSMLSHTHVTDNSTIEEAKEDLKYLIESNKIYTDSGKKISTVKLAALHKPYYLDEENKIIRAYYA